MTHDLWQQAVSFAARQHRHQLRKDGRTPYVAHPYRVALTVRHAFQCDDDVALLAALLHDTIEDTTTDYEDIATRFGDDVARCVSCLTKNMALPESEREREYDERLANGPWQARLVKLADAFDNLCDLDSIAGGERDRVRRDSIDRAHRAISLCEGDQTREFLLARSVLSTLLTRFVQE